MTRQRRNAHSRCSTSIIPGHKCDHTKPYPGMPELIRDIKAQGVVCGANSNKADEFTRELIRLNYGDEFDQVIGFGAGFQPKPDPGRGAGDNPPHPA